MSWPASYAAGGKRRPSSLKRCTASWDASETRSSGCGKALVNGWSGLPWAAAGKWPLCRAYPSAARSFLGTAGPSQCSSRMPSRPFLSF
eukprot:5984084-Lingulodinium_polyedra.AAC.1